MSDQDIARLVDDPKDVWDGPEPSAEAVKAHYASRPSLRDNLDAKARLKEAHERGNCLPNVCCQTHQHHATPHLGCTGQ